jgi:sugar-specific transcriptional regulator TrmB
VSFDEEDTYLLTDMGFTKNQAKLYLTLLKLGKADGATLSKVVKSPKTVVYRTLDELKRRGLVEKEISVPYKFKATPLKEGLQIIVNQRLDYYKETRNKMEQFLLRKQSMEESDSDDQEYRLTTIEGKDRIIQIIRRQHDIAHKSIDILSTWRRWLQIIDCCFESYKKALARGVRYRIVVRKPERSFIFPEEVKVLLSNPNFELKVSKSSLSNNLGICDSKEATFNFYPSKSLKESPLIWTNHPSFVLMAQDHFDKVWMSARTYIPRGN